MAKKKDKPEKDHREYPDEVERPDYTDEEIEYRGFIIERMKRAREQREDNHDEFDGMSYEEYYESNTKAANSYIPPKQNKSDTRIVTGTTLEKVSTLLSATTNFMFEPNITAYDKNNNIVDEMGETMESLVRKSRDVEEPDYETKRPLIYKELLDQGTCFVEDVMVEWREVEKKLKKGFKWNEAVEMNETWEEKFSKPHREIRSDILQGPNVYLGNIKEFFVEYQPFVFTRSIITYETAKQLFGNWSRFKNVPYSVDHFTEGTNNTEYSDWTLIEFKEGFCELIKYYDKPNNEYQILLNGVMMLPVGFPLSALTGKIEYPIAKGDVHPISRYFAYSKSIPAKTKIDQQVLDEFYRLFIRKTQKSSEPPMANNTGKMLSSKIFDPAVIVNDIDPNRLLEIGTNEGVTQAEFEVFGLISGMIDNKSVSSVYEGQAQENKQTATEVVELKEQSMQKLGLAFTGVTNLEKKMTWLRVYSLLNHWTDAEDLRVNKFKGRLQRVFKKIEVEDTLKDGTRGKKIIEFSEKMPTSNQLLAGKKLAKKRGKNISKVVLNPKDLRSAALNWKVTIVPTKKESDKFERAQFTSSIAEGYQLFGHEAYNKEYLKRIWAQKHKLDYDQVFISKQEQKLKQMQALVAQKQAQGEARGDMNKPGGSVNDRMRQGARAAKGRKDQTGENAPNVQKKTNK